MPTASLTLSERETFALFADHEEQFYEPDFTYDQWLNCHGISLLDFGYENDEEIDQ